MAVLGHFSDQRAVPGQTGRSGVVQETCRSRRKRTEQTLALWIAINKPHPLFPKIRFLPNETINYNELGNDYVFSTKSTKLMVYLSEPIIDQ